MQLADVAMGRKKADVVIKNGRWVNVHTTEIIDGTDIAISGARIAYIGPDAKHTIGKRTDVVEASGRYLVPGLCDAHMHIESGMVTITEFCRAVMPHGTTSMFVDPHEIANVLGMDGVKLMHDEAQAMPIGVYVQMPSCVPSAPGLEDAGAKIGASDVAKAMSWPGIVGLGEMMSFPEVIAGDRKKHALIGKTMAAGKTVGGHLPIPSSLPGFHGYVASGPADDHEISDSKEAIERARRGMKAMCRLGSAWHDVAETVKAITEKGIDPRGFVLCTDDSHSGTLVHEGHMNRVVRHAIEQGVKPVVAIQMATLNTAEHFGVARDVGSITPGRVADIIISSSLTELSTDIVFASGKQVAAEGSLLIDLPAYKYPKSVRKTVKINRKLKASDFKLDVADGKAKANVIGVIENQAPTKALRLDVSFNAGRALSTKKTDIAQVSVINRHGKNKSPLSVKHGLVSGFGLVSACAIASTVMHDCHNLIVVGTDHQNMATAANLLRDIGGGVVVFHEESQIGLVELPIAGLMSDERTEIVAEKANGVVGAMAKCGCKLNNAYMQLSLLGLVVIPELRISNRGIVDAVELSVVPLTVDK